MRKNCAMLKGEAREILLGKYKLVIAAFLLTLLISTIISIPFSRILREGMYFMVPTRILTGAVGTILVEIISSILSCGVILIHLNLAKGQPAKLSDLFYPFKNRPDRYIGFILLMTVIELVSVLPGSLCVSFSYNSIRENDTTVSLPLGFLIGILLLILGIVIAIYFMLCYSQTLYIFLEDNEITTLRAMSESMRLMKGNKWRLIKLYLSFIGMAILGLISFGLGFLWISPYLNQSITQFYLNLTGYEAAGYEE